MKWIRCALLTLGAGSAALVGQTPAKSRLASSTTQSLMTDQERNIRAYIELLRSDIRTSRSQLVIAVMQLDDEDTAAFWPIYKDFEAEYMQFGDAVLLLIRDYVEGYATMTNQAADRLATRLLDLEQARSNLKRKYYGKFKDALDAITAARFLQVENQIERIVDLQVASELPVMESSRRIQP
jgi:hypothetical protein